MLDSVLESLWKFFRSLGSQPCLLAVPGDHDIVHNPAQANSGVSISSELPAREEALNFTEWFAAWQRAHPADIHFHPGLVPGDFTATVDTDGMRLGVIGLNTVGRGLHGGPHRVGHDPFANVEESLGKKDLSLWARWHQDGVLLLTHGSHRVMNLSIGALDQLREKLSSPGIPFLHLCGSRYQKDWTDALESVAQSRVIQIPSLFSERRATPHGWGYAAGQVVTSAGARKLRFFPRVASADENRVTVSAHPQLGADEEYSFPVDLRRGKTPSGSSPPVSSPQRPPAAVASSPTVPEHKPRPTAAPSQIFRIQSQTSGSDPALPPGVKPLVTVDTGYQLVRSLAWTPSGDALAVGSLPGLLTYWKVGEAEPRWSVPTSRAVVELSFSPDGQSLVSTSLQGLQAWRADGTPLRIGRVPGSLVAWSSSGLLAADSGTGMLWLLKKEQWADAAKPVRTDSAAVNCVVWSPGGRMLVQGGAEGRPGLKVWRVEGEDSASLKPVELRQVPRFAILDAAWSPDSSRVALAGRDTSIHIWNLHNGGHSMAVLEGHTDTVTSLSFSSDGRLLASKSRDGTVRLWRTDTWEEAARIDEPSPYEVRQGLAFSPTESVLATLGAGNTGIRLWNIDVDALLQRQAPSATVHELSAKVVLVGEGRAGKSSLALRLVQGRYEEMESTHGMRFWSLPLEASGEKRSGTGPRREIVLWDMGGQSEYQLVHQLFLKDSTVALMVLEPGRGERALDEVEGWNQRLLAQSGGRNIRKLLVGTKLDSALSPSDLPAIEALRKRCQLGVYVPTSAKTGQGVAELKASLAEAIDWSSIEKVSRPELFQRLRQHIQRLREAKRVVLTFLELESELRREMGSAFDSEMLQAVVGQLARQGLVADSRMVDGTRVLVLEVEQVERYAGSLIVAARDNPYGVPALDLAKVTSPGMEFPRIPREERLRRDQELLVVDCVIKMLMEHGLCLRHEGLLIFPSLFRPPEAKAGGAEFSHAISLHYDFSGPIDNIYASLVTSLALSRHFGPMRLWQDRAEFGRAGEQALGIRRVKQGTLAARGYARLEVYFDTGTPAASRELFVNFIEEHLSERGVELLERLTVTCSCGRSFAEDVVRDRLQLGRTDIVCPVCEHRTPLALGARQSRERNPELVEQLHALRTDIQEFRSQAIIEAKLEANRGVTEGLKKGAAPDAPLRILHLSDLHVGAADEPASLFQPLEADLQDRKAGLGLDRLDYLVISGDLTQRAAPQEFEKAREFVSKVIDRFGLTAERCIIVPGNHDLDWETEAYTWKKKRHVGPERLKPGTFTDAGDGYNLRDEERYPERFKNFSQHFYHPLLQRLYPLNPEEQCISVLFGEHRLQFLAMNSAWEIDEYFQDRASISEQALSRGLAAAEQQKREGLAAEAPLLRIAVWHHPATGNEKIQDTAFMERLMQAEVRLCLHGHVHENRADLVNYLHPKRRMHVVGAGSFGAPMHHRPESVPRLFNLLEIQRDLKRLRVHTRGLLKPGGAWEGWAVWPGAERGTKREFYEVELP